MVLREKFIAINTYIKKKERSQISNQTLYLKEKEKEEQSVKLEDERQKTKVRAEINEIDTREL